MNNSLIDITIVLDRSGSMESVRQDTIGGFNAFLGEHKALPGSAQVSCIQFDDIYDVLYNAVPIRDVPFLSMRTYVPRGSTALLDAIGRTLTATGARLAAQPEAERPGKVLFIIMTDGQENASHEFSSRQIWEMITHQRETYQWEIAFMGANQDAIATGASYGIPASSTLDYASTATGTRRALDTFSKAAAKMRARGSHVTEDFFTEEDKKQQ